MSRSSMDLQTLAIDVLDNPLGFLLVPLALVGLVVVLSPIYSLTRVVLDCFVLPGKSLRSFGPKGSWALVTGASDGIGLEFATQLARAHFNVLLVSRTASKLETLAKDVSNKYSVKTQTLAIDFANAGEADYARLGKAVQDLDIAVLVNNVGKSHDMPVPFASTTQQEMHDIIEINCVATLKVTQLVLPGMQSRKRGLIMTMGSFGGTMPTPLLATYSGSKAFLQQWSTALASEVAKSKITVELVQSYLVTSAMSKIRRSSAMVPTPRQFVHSALSKVGLPCGAQTFAHTSAPYWSHAVIEWAIVTFLGLNSSIVLQQNRVMHESIRQRALKKKARDAGKKSS